MNTIINKVDAAFWTRVAKHCELDPVNLVEKARQNMSQELADLALIQISTRKRISKLRAFTQQWPEFLFPSALLVEQCTAPTVADFNATVLQPKQGIKVLDLTFGLGMDAFAFARNGADVIGVDCNYDTVNAGIHNAQMMHFNMVVEQADAVQWLRSSVENRENYDLIFIDPARRHNDGRRAYNFEECSPNINEIIPLARQSAASMLVKASPMLDVDAVMRSYPNVDRLWCVGLKGECKELLLHFNFHGSIKAKEIVSVELDGNGNKTELVEIYPYATCSKKTFEGKLAPGLFLSIPTASMVKAKCLNATQQRWPELYNIGTTPPLYISDRRPANFPGRSLIIECVYESLRQAAHDMRGLKANTAVFDYPTTADALRLKAGVLPLSDDSLFLIGIGCNKKKLLLRCSRNSNH